MRKLTVCRAFTLVEMLVILAIIALLSALLLTVFSRVREGGRRTSCVSNQKQIYAAFQLYVADNAGLWPRQSVYRTSFESGTWLDGIAPLVASKEVFHCPSDSDWASREKYRDAPYRSGPPIKWASSYIVNGSAMTQDLGTNRQVILHSDSKTHKASAVLLCDGAYQPFGASPWAIPYSGDVGEAQGEVGNLILDPAGAKTQIEGCCSGTCSCTDVVAPNPRHNGRSNVLFFDGHVKSMANSQWYFPDTPYLDPARGG